MHLARERLPFLLLALGMAGCVSRSEIEELKKGQKDILAKLDQIARTGGRPQGPQGPQPGQPDPSKVYGIPIGDSPAQGPADAWVTIVEVSDYQ